METAQAAQLPLNQQITILRHILSSNPTLKLILSRAPALGIPNWYLAAGAVSQTIWNHMCGKPLETGISDYDIVYFDDGDVSWEAEDVVIQRGKKLFADINADVEIRNQARVHLWYESKHGRPCPPHTSVEAGIDTWISTSAMIGVRLGGNNNIDEDWVVYAPRGLSECFHLIVRPNSSIGTREAYEKKALRWKGIWPQLTIEPWPLQQ